MSPNFAPSCENLTMGYHEITDYSIIRRVTLVQIFRQLLNITED